MRQAKSPMSVQSDGSYPVLSPTGAGDTVSGGMLFGGVMTALYQCTVTGKGDYVSTALYNKTAIFLLLIYYFQLFHGVNC